MDQARLADALLDPAVYGSGVERVRRLETHISYVFLAGELAYKVKKAVALDFLDFSTLAARRRYCEKELELNRRLAPGLYLEVVPITGSPDRPVLGGAGPAIEYAVKMVRFPQDQLLRRVAERGELTPERVDRLAEQVARFHASVAVAGPQDRFGTAADIRKAALDNFSQIGGDDAVLASLERWTAGRCDALEPVFAERKARGFVRECHGDLHLDNVAIVSGEITIFDCLEFDERLRWIDVMSEVAFLVSDLRRQGLPGMAQRFLDRYLELTGDYEGLRVHRFYVVYRAMVRAKVHALRQRQAPPGSEESAKAREQYEAYVEVARSAIRESRGVLITHGLSGSGKTTWTQALLEVLPAIRVRSDVERKRASGLAADAPSKSLPGGGLYTAERTAATYERLLELTRGVWDAGYLVIVDATFLLARHRTAFRQLAETAGVPFLILDFVADHDTLRQRIVERRREAKDASEADLAVLERQLAFAEPFTSDELAFVVTCNTTREACDDARSLSERILERLDR